MCVGTENTSVHVVVDVDAKVTADDDKVTELSACGINGEDE